MSVKSADAAYEEFSEAVETGIREEQEKIAAERADRIAEEAGRNVKKDTVYCQR